MTLPDEERRALEYGRRLLEAVRRGPVGVRELYAAYGRPCRERVAIPALVRELARSALRHWPWEGRLDDLWGLDKSGVPVRKERKGGKA
jgi:hypothetical protein